MATSSAYHAVRAAAVVDDHRHGEHLGQFFGEVPRSNVGRPARRERHDDADRHFRHPLCIGKNRHETRAKHCDRNETLHDVLRINLSAVRPEVSKSERNFLKAICARFYPS
ncbi:MAG TPA: hypothetical protein VNM70_15885, partial [Burkholderiales bacterium]|nr:hypothetical protein [Burkholderiales bacterium]